jgi:hypothetical protein
MFRSFTSVVPALILSFAFGGSALAGGARALTPQQKSAATRQYKAKAAQQYGSARGTKVTYTGRSAYIELVGTGGITGSQPNTVLATGSGRVTIHQKPSVIAKKGKVSASLKGGEYQTRYFLLGSSAP